MDIRYTGARAMSGLSHITITIVCPKDCYNDYVQLKKITKNSTTSIQNQTFQVQKLSLQK